MRAHGAIDQLPGAGAADHVCWVYDDDAEFDAAVQEFFSGGMARGERVLCVGERVVESLRTATGGVPELESLIAQGAVETLTLAQVYGATGPFRPDQQLAYYDDATRRALDAGYRGLRVIADVSGLAADPGRRSELVRWEQIADDYAAQGSGFSAMCAYRAELAPAALVDVASVHPLVHAPHEASTFALFAESDRLVLAGSVDAFSCDRLARVLGSAPTGGDVVVLDVSRLEFLDVASCRAVAQWVARLAERSVRADHRVLPLAAAHVAGARTGAGGAGDLRGDGRVTAAPRVDRFEHEAMFYRGDDDFLAGLLPFVRDGLDAGEAVVAAEPGPRLELLRDALGPAAADVEFLDMAEIGANPARIIAVWARALDRHTREGRRLRGIGEPAFVGRRTAELAECRLHELLLNHAFDDGPGWRLLCPYDQEHLPRAVTQAALRTHPVRSTSDSRLPSSGYAAGGHAAAFAEPLPAPGDAVLRGGFGPADVPATRRTVAQWARSCGLPEDRIEVLELAASELATNSIRHGGGAGTLAMWLDGSAAVIEFSDTGVLTDPLSGRRTPTPEQVGGRGLYLVNQLCDLVQLRSSESGTTVRVTTWF